jgi:two-component SAPR family response regulator
MTMRILLVEDEAMIALHMEDMVADLGHEVAATAMRLPEALDLARRCDCDFAILDVNLAGVMSFPVADVLSHRGVPYVFATGYGSGGVEPPYNEHTIMRKPVGPGELSRAIESAAA